MSEEGTQQSDPFDPQLFYITELPLLHMLRSELVVSYIDDITIGGHISTVDEDVAIIKRNEHSLESASKHHRTRINFINNYAC